MGLTTGRPCSNPALAVGIQGHQRSGFSKSCKTQKQTEYAAETECGPQSPKELPSGPSSTVLCQALAHESDPGLGVEKTLTAHSWPRWQPHLSHQHCGEGRQEEQELKNIFSLGRVQAQPRLLEIVCQRKTNHKRQTKQRKQKVRGKQRCSP